MKTTIFTSSAISNQLQVKLEQLGDVILLAELQKTYTSVNTHADIQMAIINDQLFIDDDVWINLNQSLPNKTILNQLKPTIIKSTLGNRYPLSVPFNGKFLENTWIHHLEYSEKTILNYLNKKKMTLIHTNQGYSGCSLVLLPKKKGITADRGLYKTLVSHGYELLLINEGNIVLDGLDSGFIGGCCGYYDGVLYVNGDLSLHPDGKLMREFILKQEIKLVEVEGLLLTDIGSILFYEGDYDE